MPSEVLWSPINIPDNDSDGIDGAIGIIIFILSEFRFLVFYLQLTLWVITEHITILLSSEKSRADCVIFHNCTSTFFREDFPHNLFVLFWLPAFRMSYESCIHYKFVNTTTYSAIKFEGLEISLFDLKMKILLAKHMNHAPLEVQLWNITQSALDFSDDSKIVMCSVITHRVNWR